MNEKDNTLRVRLDKEHQRMFKELCKHYERTDPDMLRWLIRKAHEQMKEKGQ